MQSPPFSPYAPGRRRFVKGAASSVFAFQFLPDRVWGANERIRVGCIGIGGKGAVDTAGAASAGGEIVALCDVATKKGLAGKGGSGDKTRAKFKGAKFYADFREMIDSEDLDAVTVSTPDHVHAHASVMAMRKGLAVYCQKPISHSIWEARLMARVASETKVATQMGNQAHAGEPIRRAVEMVRAGVIGDVTEVHCWTDRPIWPQGMKDPLPAEPVVDGLNWDLWLGPAPGRDYNKGYVPFSWRGWWDFGTGALGDMGCHIMDMPYWALDLGSPDSVEADEEGGTEQSGPKAATVTYRFPARGEKPPVKFMWYDGKRMPEDKVIWEAMPEGADPERLHLYASRRYDMVLIGTRGKFFFKRTSTDWLITPEAVAKDFTMPERTIPRAPGNDPYREWMEAIKGGLAALSNFSSSGPFSETVLLGNLAVRLGKRLEWDGAAMKVKNAAEADGLIRRVYRKGWELE